MKFNLKTTLGVFRLTAILEGISYILLLAIGMPLKYAAHIPEVLKVMGWMHGLLFILYVVLLLTVSVSHSWGLKKSAIAFAASLLPFGTFVLDKKILREEAKAE